MIELQQLNKIELGARIRSSRENMHLSQESLADYLCITPKFLREIENGNKGLSLKNFTLLMQILNVSSDYLLLGHTSEHTAQQQRRLVCEIRYFVESPTSI